MVGTAGDGPSALAIVRAASPDTVLLDLRLPEADGWARPRWPSSGPRWPVDPGGRDERPGRACGAAAIAAGATAFVPKGGQPEAIGDALVAIARVARPELDSPPGRSAGRLTGRDPTRLPDAVQEARVIESPRIRVLIVDDHGGRAPRPSRASSTCSTTSRSSARRRTAGEAVDAGRPAHARRDPDGPADAGARRPRRDRRDQAGAARDRDRGPHALHRGGEGHDRARGRRHRLPAQGRRRRRGRGRRPGRVQRRGPPRPGRDAAAGPADARAQDAARAGRAAHRARAGSAVACWAGAAATRRSRPRSSSPSGRRAPTSATSSASSASRAGPRPPCTRSSTGWSRPPEHAGARRAARVAATLGRASTARGVSAHLPPGSVDGGHRAGDTGGPRYGRSGADTTAPTGFTRP